MSDQDLPVSVWSGSFRIGELELKCHVLSDGRRVMEADSIAALFEAGSYGGERCNTEEEMADLVRWLGGRQ